jgi:hypothetical protein
LRTERDPAAISALLNWDWEATSLGECLVYEYLDRHGKPTGYRRLKPTKPRTVNGKAAKYEAPRKSGLRLYIPAGAREAVNDPMADMLITEGEKKALSASAHGFTCVGLSGVDCWRSKGQLIPDMEAIHWKGRRVYVCFDSDAAKTHGSERPSGSSPPPSPAGTRSSTWSVCRKGCRMTATTKVGLDDFLVSHGPETLRQLLDRAAPAGEINGIDTIPAIPKVGESIAINRLIPPNLGEAAYHGWVGKFLRAVAPYTEATDAGVLAHLLPAAGMLVGSGPHVFAGNRQFARLNTVLVGPTNGGRKGTSFYPVDRLCERAVGKLWREQRRNGLSTGEGLIAAVADRVSRNEDGETETESVEKWLIVVEEEFSRVLAQARRDGNILSQVIREAFDGGNLNVMTRGFPHKR